MEAEPGGHGDKVVPGLAAGFQDGLVGFIETDGQLVLAQILPDVFDRVQLQSTGRQREQGDVVGHLERLARNQRFLRLAESEIPWLAA